MYYTLKYTDDMPVGTGGYARTFLIRIRPKYRDDVGIHKHEIYHVKQFWQTLGFHGLFYICSKKYRLWSEVQAYSIQLQYQPALSNVELYRDMYAGFIVTDYKLNHQSWLRKTIRTITNSACFSITKEEVIPLLKGVN